MDPTEREAQPLETLDALAEGLQRYRTDSGDVSYAEIASRIARRRELLAMSPAAARVARSSVYDVFRAGRSRTNPELVAEIVLALGGAEEEAESWRMRCLSARAATRRRPVDIPAPDAPVRPASSPSPHRTFVVVFLIACFGLNIFGGAVVARFHLPVFLDMVGTALSAVVLGPWSGALVGLATNGLGALATVPETIPYALVNIVGALVWGYGVRLWPRARSPLPFLALSAVVALACTMTAVPIDVFVFGGMADHASDSFTAALLARGEALWPAVASVNIVASLADKLISGAIALVLLRQIDRLPFAVRDAARPVRGND